MPGPRKEGAQEYFEVPKTSPEIKEMGDFLELKRRIRQVTLLNESIKGLHPYLKSVINLEEVTISELHPLALYVLNQNLLRQRQLRQSFLPQGIDTFHMSSDQALIRYEWAGEEHTLVPPIVEVSEDDGYLWVITDGLHRVVSAKEAGEPSITAVVIQNTAVPLSVLPVGWEEVRRLDQVPPTREKRRLRFQSAQESFRWFGLNNRNLERFVSGFSDISLSDFGYKVFFRNLDFSVKERVSPAEAKFSKELPTSVYERRGLAKSPIECLREYNYAGFIITTLDRRHVLLGNYKEAPDLWGNFAGRREGGEIDPAETAVRELREELGINIDPDEDFGEPLIIIKNTNPQRVRIAFNYLLSLGNTINFEIPETSEIESVRWFSWGDVCALMDAPRPDYSLWGGPYTAEALNEWITMSAEERLSREYKFGGLIQIDAYHFGPSLYEKFKMERAQVQES